MISYLEDTLISEKPLRKKKILWFTDSLTDLNGVSVTLKKIGWLAHKKNIDIKIATSLTKEELGNGTPPNVMNIPDIYRFNLLYYEFYQMKIPSILRSLKMIYQFEPDEIYISTPGPLGVFGLLVARILSVKSIAVYHTDFTEQANKIVGNESLAQFLMDTDKWFHSVADEVHVPTVEYIDILKERGFNPKKIKVFRRGVDLDMFTPNLLAKENLKKKYNTNGGVNLMFSGRISKDKNLDFLIELYKELLDKGHNINLFIVGDGPYLSQLKEKTSEYNQIFFTGQLNQDEMPALYAASDLFVFPSTTDTFGMVVLEAQACGCPAIVSNVGGPQEIIINNKTGYIENINNYSTWVKRIEKIINLIENNSSEYTQMRIESRLNAQKNYNWDVVLKNMLTF